MLQSSPPPSNRQAILAGTELVTELLDIRRRRLRGDPAETVLPDLDAWRTRRTAWGEGLRLASTRGVDLPLLTLIQRFALSDREVDILLITICPEVDPEYLDVLADAHEGFPFRGTDLELVLGLLFHSKEERFVGRALLSPAATLIRHGLVRLAPIGSGVNPHDVEVKASEAMANFVLERPLVTGKLAGFCSIIRPRHSWDRVILPVEQKDLIWQLVAGEPELRRCYDEWGYSDVLTSGRGVTLLLAGPPGVGKTAFAHALASRLERPLLVVQTSRLTHTPEPLEPILSEIFRVAGLGNAVILIDDCEGLMTERDARFLALLEALEHNDGLLILTTNDAPRIDPAVSRRILYRLDFETPTPLLREQIWEVHLPSAAPLAADISVPSLANTYEFTGAMIRSTVLIALARMVATGEQTLSMHHLRKAAETQLRARFDDLALRMRGSFPLSSLVLPEQERAQLNEALDACRCHEDVLNRWGFGKSLASGRGICILLDGPPGTGKTFSAEIMAAELKLPLYRVHIPNIVSKWVGETERNISDIFARARSSRAVLLFDEADSLFGRRSTSAQSANDRYANMEVNLLLQEVERYDGITILTTNLFGNLDEALQRRIQFRVTFPFPEPSERARIWEALMPGEAPLSSDVNFKRLGAQFELAGGHIKNALLRAAYRARSSGGPITHAHLADAALAESRAQGKLVRDQTRVPTLVPE